MPMRWRRSHSDLRLMPRRRASSVSVSECWWARTKARKYSSRLRLNWVAPLAAAAPLARTAVFDEPVVQELAETYDKTPAQIVIRWQVQNGIVTIPRSTTPEHIRSNLAVTDWRLDEAEMDRIEAISRRDRQYMIDPDHPRYGISE